MSEQSSAPRAPPTNHSDDTRVHFNKASGRWAYEDDEGNEYEWNFVTEQWDPVMDETLIEQQQKAYAVEGVDETTPAAPVASRSKGNKKRRRTSDSPNDDASAKKAAPPARKSAVYVTGLPRDPPPSMQEIYDTFAKCGLILEDGSGEPKIKLYPDEKGNFNGECLVVFLQDDSVGLAERLLDDTELRLGSGQGNMTVKAAEWSHKQNGGGKDGPSKDAEATGNSANSEGTATGRPKGRKGGDPEKQKAQKRAEKQKNSLNDWRDEEDEPTIGGSVPQPKFGKVVVLSRMFSLNDLDEDPKLTLELKEDVREECETIGEVTNVVLYDKEPEGIMTVRFKDPLAAQACIMKMNGRFFSGRQIGAEIYDGRRKFRKSGQGQVDEQGDKEESQRLEEFGKWLEEGNE